MRLRLLAGCLLLLGAAVQRAPAIVLLGTDDPSANTTTPGDNSGWQYEGQFGGFLGTPIAPYFFIAAHHIGGSVGDPIVYHGQSFTTVAFYDDMSSDDPPVEVTDLRIWQVETPFPTYAPVSQTGAEVGHELRMFGRGAQRGDPILLDGVLKGWQWGNDNYLQRWGADIASSLSDDANATYVMGAFDRNGIPNEADLSGGDSSGGVFLLEDGLWKLAAINYGVDDLYYADGTFLLGAIFDSRGFYTKDDQGALSPVPDAGVDVPLSFYSTRLAPRMGWIRSIVGGDLSALPTEDYATWLHGYYTPAQIADSAASDPAADPDGDGVVNLLEFAFNLDPTYPEPVILTPDTGVCGLPSIRVEGSGDDQRLTIEYLRRISAGVTYAAQFTGDLAADAWATNPTETVTAINARWERVKTSDPVALSAAPAGRFGRVQVSVNAPPAAAQSKSGPRRDAPRKLSDRP